MAYLPNFLSLFYLFFFKELERLSILFVCMQDRPHRGHAASRAPDPGRYTDILQPWPTLVCKWSDNRAPKAGRTPPPGHPRPK